MHLKVLRCKNLSNKQVTYNFQLKDVFLKEDVFMDKWEN